MNSRQRLIDRRFAESFTFELDGLHYTGAVSRFPDGRIGEVSICNSKPNSAADRNARDVGIVCSIALQHGVDLEVIRTALSRDAQGRPASPLGVLLEFVCGGERDA
jgi:hypothetical protein